ncbi:unnamed protein product (macronuclear) [Paramecium tetraurelia]|uniref:Transmembrane protein n=1 Tax=Paramecium tetraurelia TaxID=5888 RepID=A0DNT5_PARTE|nr:uncharacterized protein GSPATT00018898001 [Paramecium tetraurelia]CAK84702.1 unnamed protein product [Paramecium tetraurelia]|eukprot:XP_001452099.1 hypothetical protein (macronuclear) [Paramecium tetraurelia strain d4-2]
MTYQQQLKNYYYLIIFYFKFSFIQSTYFFDLIQHCLNHYFIFNAYQILFSQPKFNPSTKNHQEQMYFSQPFLYPNCQYFYLCTISIQSLSFFFLVIRITNYFLLQVNVLIQLLRNHYQLNSVHILIISNNNFLSPSNYPSFQYICMGLQIINIDYQYQKLSRFRNKFQLNFFQRVVLALSQKQCIPLLKLFTHYNQELNNIEQLNQTEQFFCMAQLKQMRWITFKTKNIQIQINNIIQQI